MKDIEVLIISMGKRVKKFGADNPLDPPNAKATEHYGELDDYLATLAGLGGSQDLASGTLLGTTDQKELAAAALRKQMRKLAKTAKILNKAVYPTVAAEMRLGGAWSYPQLLERGRAFLASLADKTAVFIEYGAPDTVLADLQAGIDAVESAIGHKDSAMSKRVGSTAGLGAISRAVVRVARKLDAIMSTAYENDPVLLAAWKSAQRIHRDRIDNPGEPESPAPPAEEPPAGS